MPGKNVSWFPRQGLWRDKKNFPVYVSPDSFSPGKTHSYEERDNADTQPAKDLHQYCEKENCSLSLFLRVRPGEKVNSVAFLFTISARSAELLPIAFYDFSERSAGKDLWAFYSARSAEKHFGSFFRLFFTFFYFLFFTVLGNRIFSSFFFNAPGQKSFLHSPTSYITSAGDAFLRRTLNKSNTWKDCKGLYFPKTCNNILLQTREMCFGMCRIS